MAYSDFTLSRVRKELGIHTTEVSGLFDQVPSLIASELLKEMLDRSGRLARLIGTEKAKSEFLIAPILAEIVAQMNDQVSLFSGTEFNIDPEKGLQGFCDFILSQSAEQLEITAPVITIAVGAACPQDIAKNDNIKSGIGQPATQGSEEASEQSVAVCIAEMVGAQIFNQREGRSIAAIQGVVTTGSSWLFMRLIDSQVEIDDREYHINELDKIIGILIAPLREC
jgi:hypothetical protein